MLTLPPIEFPSLYGGQRDFFRTCRDTVPDFFDKPQAILTAKAQNIVYLNSHRSIVTLLPDSNKPSVRRHNGLGLSRRERDQSFQFAATLTREAVSWRPVLAIPQEFHFQVFTKVRRIHDCIASMNA